MGKIFLHGRGNKITKSEPRAKLTVRCPVGLAVRVKSAKSSLTFTAISDETGKAEFNRLTEGVWDVTVTGVDNPPTERIRIDSLECDVNFPYMTIYVTYPAGSICTCSMGDAVLTAPDRTGSCSFNIYDLGDWTVTATNGVEYASEVISVVSFDEFVSINLIHDLYIVDSTGQRYIIDPIEFWGNDDKNVEMFINDDNSVSFKFLTAQTGEVVSNKTIDFTGYSHVYITSVLDRAGTVRMSLTHPVSAAVISGAWGVDNDTETSDVKCNCITSTGERLIRISSHDEADTIMTIKSMSLRSECSAINVAYPPGSSCICSNGTTILTNPDISGSCLFMVNEVGEWTISVTYGDVTLTDVVSINRFGVIKTINLNDAFAEHSIALLITDRSKVTTIYLPNDLSAIGNFAFYDCTNLALTSLPEGITSIGYGAFYNCTNLTSITFKGMPTSINYTAFQNCTNLKTINVPWAEGAVANAPWGATNATINYNYTGEG